MMTLLYCRVPVVSQKVAIYADGAASPNPGAGGWGVVLIRNGQRQELSGGFCKTTNNRMEILGVIMGLRSLKVEKSEVTIYSDSRYVVDMFNGGYAEGWRRNAWKRNNGKVSVLNPDLWNELLELSARHEVRFVWVRGHANSKENMCCDALAVKARQAAFLPQDEGYATSALHTPPKQLMLFDEV